MDVYHFSFFIQLCLDRRAFGDVCKISSLGSDLETLDSLRRCQLDLRLDVIQRFKFAGDEAVCPGGLLFRWAFNALVPLFTPGFLRMADFRRSLAGRTRGFLVRRLAA